MSLARRMAAIVGDQNTVARYLAEKVGHTALIAWAFVSILRLELLPAAAAATLLYLIIGKILWHRAHAGAWDVKDAVFDALVGGLVIVLAVFHAYGLTYGAGSVGAWVILFAILDNNAWGSPS